MVDYTKNPYGNYGTPLTQEEIEQARDIRRRREEEEKKRAAREGRNASIGQALGGIAGTAGGIYVANKVPQWMGEGTKKPTIGQQLTNNNPSPQAQVADPSQSQGGIVAPQSPKPSVGGALTNSGPTANQAPLQGPENATTIGGGQTTTELPQGSQVTADGQVIDSEGIPIGRAVQGAAGVYMIYSGLEQGGVQGGASVAAGGINTAAALGNQTAASVAPYAGGITAAANIYGHLNTDNMSDREKAARSEQEAWLAVGDYFTGGAASAFRGAIMQTSFGRKMDKKLTSLAMKTNPALMLFGQGKHEDQRKRDDMRDHLERQGIAHMDEETGSHHVTLADGSTYNIGQDGDTRIQTYDPNAVVDDSGPGQVRAYDVDTSNPFHQSAVGWINPLAEIMVGGNDKLRSDLVGYLANASMSNAKSEEDVRQNALAIMNQMGLDPQTADSLITQLADEGEVTEEQLAAYRNGLGTLTQGVGAAPASSPSSTESAAPSSDLPPGAAPIPPATLPTERTPGEIPIPEGSSLQTLPFIAQEQGATAGAQMPRGLLPTQEEMAKAEEAWRKKRGQTVAGALR